MHWLSATSSLSENGVKTVNGFDVDVNAFCKSVVLFSQRSRALLRSQRKFGDIAPLCMLHQLILTTDREEE